MVASAKNYDSIPSIGNGAAATNMHDESSTLVFGSGAGANDTRSTTTSSSMRTPFLSGKNRHPVAYMAAGLMVVGLVLLATMTAWDGNSRQVALSPQELQASLWDGGGHGNPVVTDDDSDDNSGTGHTHTHTFTAADDDSDSDWDSDFDSDWEATSLWGRSREKDPVVMDDESDDNSGTGHTHTHTFSADDDGNSDLDSEATSTKHGDKKPPKCTFLECWKASCSWSLAPYVCLRNNGGPHMGCSPSPWEKGTCDEQCDLSSCDGMKAPSELDDDHQSCKHQKCPEEWCCGDQTCGTSVPYQCLEGSARFGCSDDPMQWGLKVNDATCSKCCDIKTCSDVSATACGKGKEQVVKTKNAGGDTIPKVETKNAGDTIPKVETKNAGDTISKAGEASAGVAALSYSVIAITFVTVLLMTTHGF